MYWLYVLVVIFSDRYILVICSSCMYNLGAAAGSPLYCFHLSIMLHGFMLEVHVHER